jgi:hypothetical protein
MNKIPIAVYINNILPYTYNIQHKNLLDDIKNYCQIKNKLMNNIYDSSLIKREIFSLFYIYPELLKTILNRYYNNLLLKKINIINIYFLPIDKIFSIIFGLLTVNERIKFLDHIKEDDDIWFKIY